MQFFNDGSPIIACSTGNFSNTAVSVIRLSGFENFDSLKYFFSIKKKVRSRFSYLTNILDGDKVIDNVLIVFFPEGKSFTGENVLEISCHGNLLNIDKIINLFIEKANFKLAAPGEFSYRAFKNKKLSISQVEGLDLLLNANSSLMLEQGLELLNGNLHKEYVQLYEVYLKLRASLEILIDFSEDVGDDQAEKLFLSNLNQFKELINSLALRSEGNISNLLNPEIVIVGETNAGKSSLFNILLNQNRSIVSSIPGTTRDYVSDTIYFSGAHFSLIDTAGIRESSDEIEKIGMERAFDILNRAFFKILVINPNSYNKDYLNLFKSFEFDLILFSHFDENSFTESFKNFDFSLVNFKSYTTASFKIGSIGPIVNSGSIGPVANSGSIGPDVNSGSIGPAIRDLISRKYLKSIELSPVIKERHRDVINKINLKTKESMPFMSNINDLGVISQELNLLSAPVSELLGITSSDDILNSIFSTFCIGK
jgi:tRNA modification GTPase